MTAPNRWTPAEDAAVSAHYAKHGAQAALDALAGVSVAPRTLKAVEVRAWHLGLRMTQHSAWTDADDAAMREHYPQLGCAAVARMLCRTESAVLRRAVRLHLYRDPQAIKAARSAPRKARTAPRKPHGNAPELRRTASTPAPKPAPRLIGEPIITSETRVTIAPPFRGRWDMPTTAPRVVSADECREWARAAA